MWHKRKPGRGCSGREVCTGICGSSSLLSCQRLSLMALCSVDLLVTHHERRAGCLCQTFFFCPFPYLLVASAAVHPKGRGCCLMCACWWSCRWLLLSGDQRHPKNFTGIFRFTQSRTFISHHKSNFFTRRPGRRAFFPSIV